MKFNVDMGRVLVLFRECINHSPFSSVRVFTITFFRNGLSCPLSNVLPEADSLEIKFVVKSFSNFLGSFTTMYYFKNCNERGYSPFPRKIYDPLKLSHNFLQYSLSNTRVHLISSYHVWWFRNRNCIRQNLD